MRLNTKQLQSLHEIPNATSYVLHAFLRTGSIEIYPVSRMPFLGFIDDNIAMLIFYIFTCLFGPDSEIGTNFRAKFISHYGPSYSTDPHLQGYIPISLNHNSITPMPAKQSKSPFKHPWWLSVDRLFSGPENIGESMRCLDDRLIIELSKAIRAKSGWTTKYKDKEIVEKWKEEFKDQNPKSRHVDEVFDYMLRELQWYDKIESTRPEFSDKKFKMGPDDRIVFSDEAIDEKTAESFASAVTEFEKVTPKDYHPGSNNLVVDLVHPSLFHLQYGRTKMVKEGALRVVEYEEEVGNFKKTDFLPLKRFQWLPAELCLDRKSKTFSFTSYINNLHPLKFPDLYSRIAAVFNEVIPGLNFSLARYLSKQYIRVPIPAGPHAYKGTDDEFYEKYEIDGRLSNEEFTKARIDFLRDFPPTYTEDPVTENFDVRDFSRLKVIVKLANIELTPENPKYAGGSWHVEGTINEDIVATVLYYYHMDNIKDSKLSFRAGVSDPYDNNVEDGLQIDPWVCEHFYGLKMDEEFSYPMGAVDAQEGRVVIFPNYFQHHVDPFELIDPHKPGLRKILCFFVVDPYNDLVKSTKDVPPQMKEWVEDKELMSKYFPEIKPEEVTTMSWEEATKARDELMAERAEYDLSYDDFDAYHRYFSFCEH